MTTPLDRLAQRVKERRLELGIARDKGARGVGMSKDTWKRVEEGAPVRDLSYARLEQALQWAAGSCAAILDGKEPITVEEAAGGVIATIPDALESEVREAVTLATVATTSSLTGNEIRALSEEVMKELRKRGVLPDVPDLQQ